jgi:predicted RNA-binding Zn ribbon-like protein
MQNTAESIYQRLHHTTATLVKACLRGYAYFGFESRDEYLSQKELGNVRALFVAGHPALDFLNTRMRVNHALVDIFEGDEDVLAWLKQAGFPLPAAGAKIEPLSLLRSARKLREHIRLLVERRKAGLRADPSVLNNFLAASQSHPRLLWNKPNSLKIDRVRRQDTSESILAPVAESATDLLANADFELVKRCEDETCVLWFSDQTKSHHRRWCSMEICGNRHKVAAYRERRRDQAASRG